MTKRNYQPIRSITYLLLLFLLILIPSPVLAQDPTPTVTPRPSLNAYIETRKDLAQLKLPFESVNVHVEKLLNAPLAAKVPSRAQA